MMDWLEYLRGYDEGKRDENNYRNNNGGGIIIVLIRLCVNLVVFAIALCFFLLKIIFKLFTAAIKYKRLK